MENMENMAELISNERLKMKTKKHLKGPKMAHFTNQNFSTIEKCI